MRVAETRPLFFIQPGSDVYGSMLNLGLPILRFISGYKHLNRCNSHLSDNYYNFKTDRIIFTSLIITLMKKILFLSPFFLLADISPSLKIT
jgi:hypothetical protein